MGYFDLVRVMKEVENLASKSTKKDSVCSDWRRVLQDWGEGAAEKCQRGFL